VQGQKQRHLGCGDQREGELADRRTGRRDVEQLVSGEGAEGQGHNQVGHAERVEPQGGPAAGALREPACDQQRGDTGGDVAEARGQGEQRGQMAEGHDKQEGHPGHAERVRKLQAAGHARRRQRPRYHRDPAQYQQQTQEADHRDWHPRHLMAEPRVVPAVTRDHRAGGKPAAEHGNCAAGEQARTPSAQAGAHRAAVQHDAGRGRDRGDTGDGNRPHIVRRVVHNVLLESCLLSTK
jgi:hypothetical protein